MTPKSDVSEIKTPRAFERFLRDAGFPKAFAVAVTERGFKSAIGHADSAPISEEHLAAIKSMSAALRAPTSEKNDDL